MNFIKNYIGWIFESQKDRSKMLTLDEVKKIIGESIVEQSMPIDRQYPLKVTFAEALDILNSIPQRDSKEKLRHHIRYTSPYDHGGEHFPLPDMYSFDLTLDARWSPGEKYPYGTHASYHTSFADECLRDRKDKGIRLRNVFRSFRSYDQGIEKKNEVTLDKICSEFYENAYIYYHASCLKSIFFNKVI